MLVEVWPPLRRIYYEDIVGTIHWFAEDGDLDRLMRIVHCQVPEYEPNPNRATEFHAETVRGMMEKCGGDFLVVTVEVPK
jgi:hypothetical protein